VDVMRGGVRTNMTVLVDDRKAPVPDLVRQILESPALGLSDVRDRIRMTCTKRLDPITGDPFVLYDAELGAGHRNETNPLVPRGAFGMPTKSLFELDIPTQALKHERILVQVRDVHTPDAPHPAPTPASAPTPISPTPAATQTPAPTPRRADSSGAAATDAVGGGGDGAVDAAPEVPLPQPADLLRTACKVVVVDIAAARVHESTVASQLDTALSATEAGSVSTRRAAARVARDAHAHVLPEACVWAAECVFAPEVPPPAPVEEPATTTEGGDGEDGNTGSGGARRGRGRGRAPPPPIPQLSITGLQVPAGLTDWSVCGSNVAKALPVLPEVVGADEATPMQAIPLPEGVATAWPAHWSLPTPAAAALTGEGEPVARVRFLPPFVFDTSPLNEANVATYNENARLLILTPTPPDAESGKAGWQWMVLPDTVASVTEVDKAKQRVAVDFVVPASTLAAAVAAFPHTPSTLVVAVGNAVTLDETECAICYSMPDVAECNGCGCDYCCTRGTTNAERLADPALPSELRTILCEGYVTGEGMCGIVACLGCTALHEWTVINRDGSTLCSSMSAPITSFMGVDETPEEAQWRADFMVTVEPTAAGSGSGSASAGRGRGGRRGGSRGGRRTRRSRPEEGETDSEEEVVHYAPAPAPPSPKPAVYARGVVSRPTAAPSDAPAPAPAGDGDAAAAAPPLPPPAPRLPPDPSMLRYPRSLTPFEHRLITTCAVADEAEFFCGCCGSAKGAAVAHLQQARKRIKAVSQSKAVTSAGALSGAGATSGVPDRTTDVDITYVGTVPGVEVGSVWDTRIAMAAAGVMWQSMPGINASRYPDEGKDGSAHANALVVKMYSKYKNPVDTGEELLYSVAGGTNLRVDAKTGKAVNRRTGDIEKDQSMDTGTNRALVISQERDIPIRVFRGVGDNEMRKWLRDCGGRRPPPRPAPAPAPAPEPMSVSGEGDAAGEGAGAAVAAAPAVGGKRKRASAAAGAAGGDDKDVEAGYVHVAGDGTVIPVYPMSLPAGLPRIIRYDGLYRIQDVVKRTVDKVTRFYVRLVRLPQRKADAPAAFRQYYDEYRLLQDGESTKGKTIVTVGGRRLVLVRARDVHAPAPWTPEGQTVQQATSRLFEAIIRARARELGLPVDLVAEHFGVTAPTAAEDAALLRQARMNGGRDNLLRAIWWDGDEGSAGSGDGTGAAGGDAAFAAAVAADTVRADLWADLTTSAALSTLRRNKDGALVLSPAQHATLQTTFKCLLSQDWLEEPVRVCTTCRHCYLSLSMLQYQLTAGGADAGKCPVCKAAMPEAVVHDPAACVETSLEAVLAMLRGAVVL